MTQAEPQVTSTQLPEQAANDTNFSSITRQNALGILRESEIGIAGAALQPFRAAAAWLLGVEFGGRKDWAAVVDARARFREGTLSNLPEASDDAIIQTKEGKKAA